MKTVKCFISSTFKDMNAERDVLIKSVFPRLREKAEAMGVRIQEIDLRWGVTEEDVKKGEVLDLCLDSIEECKPYFICLLGRRYGWIPAPVHIMRDEFENMISDPSVLDEKERGLLKYAYHMEDNGRVYKLDVTTPNSLKDEIQKILEKAGIRDSGTSITGQEINYVMSMYMLPHSIPYMDKLLSKGAGEKLISGEDREFIQRFYSRYGSEQVWRKLPGIYKDEESRIMDILKRLGYRRDYHRFFFLRDDEGEKFYHIDDRGTLDSCYVETDEAMKTRLESLKSRIEQSGMYEGYSKYPCKWDRDNAGKEDKGIYPVTGLGEFEEIVFASLWNHMENNIELKNMEQVQKSLIEKEHEEQLKFIDSRTYNFCGRKELLTELEDAVEKALSGQLKAKGKNTHTIMVVGEPGSGKSALLAEFYNKYIRNHSDCLVIPRFIGGGSSRSTNPKNMLADFCTLLMNRQVGEHGTNSRRTADGALDEPQLPWDLDGLKKAFTGYLQKADKNVVIILDAINQLHKEEGARMMWLPDDLPDNVCIITSLVDDGSKGNKDFDIDDAALESMRKKSIPPFEIRMTRLTEDEKKQIIHSYLRQFNKRLHDGLVGIIAEKAEAHHPLYLQIALEELRLVSRHEEIEGYIKDGMPGTSVDMFKQILDRLHKELGRRLGGSFFEEFMVYMAAGRNGMTEEDLRLLLGGWKNVNETGKQEAGISDYHWGELRRAMRAYLIQRGDEWDFFHQQLRQAVEERYMGSDDRKRVVHERIAEYLELMGYKHATTVKDLPYHLSKAKGGDEGGAAGQRLKILLRDYGFISAKVNMGMVSELIDDYGFDNGDRLSGLLRSVVVLSAHVISLHPEQLPSQLSVRLAGHREKEILSLMEDIRLKTRTPWIRPKTCSFESPDSCLIRTLSGHSRSVEGVIVTPDGRRAVSASWDNTLKVWDLESGREIHTLTGHSDVVTSVSVTPDGRKAVSASWDGTVKVWDMESGREIYTLEGHYFRVDSVTVMADGRRAVSRAWSHMKIWDIEKGIELEPSCGKKKLPGVGMITTDGRMALSELPDNVIKVWDIASMKELYIFHGYLSDYRKFSMMPDGRTAVCVSNDDNSIRMLDLKHGKVIWSIPCNTEFIKDMKITADGRMAVCTLWDHSMKVWDLVNRRELYILRGHSSDVNELCITRDGSRVVSASSDHTLKVWRLDERIGNYICTQHTGAIQSIDLTPDGRIAISASADSTLKVWDLGSSSEIWTLKGHTGSVLGSSITPDGKFAVSTSLGKSLGENRIKVWDLESGRELYTLETRNNLEKARLTPDGRYAMDAFGLYYLKVWDIRANAEVCMLEHSDRISDVCVAPDGITAVTASADGTINVWNLKKKKKIRTIKAHDDKASQVKITPDGEKLISASWDNTLKIWTMDKGRLVKTLKGHKSSVACIYISPDGRKVVSWDYDRIIKIWDMESGVEICTFNEGPPDLPLDAGIAPNGRMAAYSSRRAITLVDMERGEVICKLIGDSNFLCVKMVSNDELIAGDTLGNMHFLSLENVNAACQLSFQGKHSKAND